MQATWIIVALRTLAKWFWPSARKSTTSAQTTVASPSSEPSPAVPDDVDTELKHPPVDSIPSNNLGHAGGTSEELSEIEQVAEENGITALTSTSPKPPSDFALAEQGSSGLKSGSVDEPSSASMQAALETPVTTALPADADHEFSLAETGGHSEGDGPKEARYNGNDSTEQPQKLGRKPREIGGRRGRQSPNHGSETRSQTPPSRPELICRRDPASMTWEIILTAGEECELSTVLLEGELLDHNAQGYCIPSFTGQLVVSCQGEQRHNVPLFEDNPLIFKLRKNWSGEGKKIARITSGHFIVIAPATWERIGSGPVEPDGCSDAEFRAHYFYRDAATSDESVDGFREWSDSLVATGIGLSGRCVFDDSDEGNLFVGDAPSLNSLPDIVWVRVGEEIEDGWGQNFQPDEQLLPEVLGGQEGRFFLRVFDSEVRLLDSTSFRYLRNLRRICVNGTDYVQDMVLVPSSTGHLPTEVSFVGADGSAITPILPTEALQAVMPSGVLVAPPHPDADRVSCTLVPDESGVEIVLDLPRIWWRLEDGRSDPGKWHDTPYVMMRQEFQEHADSNMSLVLLSKRQTTVRAGFDDEPIQPYRRLTEDDRIVIPLTHFVDHAQIDQRLSKDAHFNVEWAGEIVSLIRISADPIPEICSFTARPTTIFAGEEVLLEWTTQNVGNALVSIDPNTAVVDSNGTFTVRPTKTTRYTLTLMVYGTDSISSTVTVSVEQLRVPVKRPVAQVMATGGGWRCGKGFSFQELKDAGVAVQEVVERSIPIDRRRRTSHRANIERVRSMLDD